MAIQTVTFSRDESPPTVNGGNGWTVAEARAWLQANDFRSPKVDRTENRLRFRQFPPGQCNPDSFSTLTEDLPRGVQLVDCTRE